MKLEIVSHCWHYSRLLRYQLSSLFLHPPGESVEVPLTVVLTPEDQETVEMVRFFQAQTPTAAITIRPWPMPKGQLFLREIGRNQVALTIDADWGLVHQLRLSISNRRSEWTGRGRKKCNITTGVPASVSGQRNP